MWEEALWAAGGGAIALFVVDVLVVDGELSVLPCCRLEYAQGGAGGSLLIVAAKLQGAGKVSAVGEKDPYAWGHGAGGRIAMYVTESTFVGTITAMCGSGVPTPGCDGTVVLEVAGQ